MPTLRQDRHFFSLNGLIIACTALLLTSCLERQVNTRTADENQQQPNNNNGYQPPPSNGSGGSSGGGQTPPPSGNNGHYSQSVCSTSSPPGIADGNQTIEYYQSDILPTVIAHGSAWRPPNHSPHYPDGIVWSSATDLPPGISPNIFYSNQRFNLRVKALSGVNGVKNSKGIDCTQVPLNYQKLSIGARLRKQGSLAGQYVKFEGIPVGQFSKVKEFNVPQGTSEPLILEFSDLEWDFTCQDLQGTDYNIDEFCPYAPVWFFQCVRFQFEFSTDSTKDIPCPRL